MRVTELPRIPVDSFYEYSGPKVEKVVVGFKN
jgi:hypothetical protein